MSLICKIFSVLNEYCIALRNINYLLKFFMNVIEVKDGCPIKGEIEQMTDEQLQNEYNFYIAESIVAMLHREGKITDDEIHKISALNRQKFSPKLAGIMP